jgi:hypothetical protein
MCRSYHACAARTLQAGQRFWRRVEQYEQAAKSLRARRTQRVTARARLLAA